MRAPGGRRAVLGLLVVGLIALGGPARVGSTTLVPLGQVSTPGGLAVREIGRGDQSNIDGLREVVVRDQAAWLALWREHNYDLPAPRVDFAKEMVVAVFLGSQTSAGHGVRISDVISSDGALVVRYQASRPAPGGVTAQVLTFPFHVVAIARMAGAVRFERQQP